MYVSDFQKFTSLQVHHTSYLSKSIEIDNLEYNEIFIFQTIAYISFQDCVQVRKESVVVEKCENIVT